MQNKLVIEILETCIQRRECKRICLDCKYYGSDCVEAHKEALDAVQIRMIRNAREEGIRKVIGYE